MATRSLSGSILGGTKYNSFSYAATIDTNLIIATGTVTKNANNSYSYTGDGTFAFYPKGVPKSSSNVTSKSVEYLVVAGGGAGGYSGASNFGGAGGGAGGYRTSSTFSITLGAKTVTVGAGASGDDGGGQPAPGRKGSDSVFDSITSTGGGGGACLSGRGQTGGSGGSGGGGGGVESGWGQTGGAGNTPSTVPSQGNNGSGASADKGSGGGAGSASPSLGVAGSGSSSSISGTSVTYAAGGVRNNSAAAGTSNTGNGGAGATGTGSVGGNGGSGIVIIKVA
jgi:hypothetical protein